MPTRAHDRFFEEQRERDRRYGLEHDEYAEFVHELELADRIADQARCRRATRSPGRRPATGSAAALPLTSSRTSLRRDASPSASA